MQCLCCSSDVSGSQAKLFDGIMLCGSCNAQAESLERELNATVRRMELQMREWLKNYILSGELMGGSHAADVAVPSLRGDDQRRLAHDPVPEGFGPERDTRNLRRVPQSDVPPHDPRGDE